MNWSDIADVEELSERDGTQHADTLLTFHFFGWFPAFSSVSGGVVVIGFMLN